MAVLKYNSNLFLSDGELQIHDGIIPEGAITISDTSKTDVSEYSSAILNTPSDLIPANIRENITILGVTGTLHEGIEPSGTINIYNTNQTDVRSYQYAQLINENLLASNIKKDVTIFGITGTYDNLNPNFQTKTINPSPNWTSAITLTQDGDYDGLEQVNISAIPYSETLNSAGGYTVEIF